MDNNDIERERGITIFAKNCAIDYPGRQIVHINIVDTPGHADFGGEVERVLGMVDGVLLLVDAVEGPMPQTRFVTMKALAAGPAADRRREQGRSARRAPRMGGQPDVRAVRSAGRDRCATRFSGRLRIGAQGWSTLDVNAAKSPLPAISLPVAPEGSAEDVGEGRDMRPLFETILAHVPAPAGEIDAPLQFQVSALDYSSYVGRLGIGRIRRGSVCPGQEVAILESSARERRSPGARTRRPGIHVRGAQSRSRRARRRRRHRARHRHRRPDDRHDARRGRCARGAAADFGRRADAVDVLPGQHVAARGSRRQIRDVAQSARPACARAADEHGAARRRYRRHRRVSRLGPRRAAPHDPARKHAPRRLRARCVAAARRVEGNRRRDLRAVRAAVRRRRGAAPGRGDGSARCAPRRPHEHGIRFARTRAARVPDSGARA